MVAATFLLSALALRPSGAQQLGRIEFPTSGAAAAQVLFITGVLYLHSFEYPSALRAFREAERLDPGFAMAYWGEAMTYTHPVWNQQDLTSARAALQKLGPTAEARAAKAPTARERQYLHAMEVLYGSGSKPARDTAYAAAMGQLVAQFPADEEAQLFHALALLGLNQGDRDIPTYQRAGAIAAQVFAHNRQHPGAAHYVIHAYDDPQHAQLGLDAARAYSGIAPDAAHAQHMTSHIFLALGLWDDVVAANETAVHLIHSANERAGNCGHYPEWLGYAYLQQGRLADATRVLDECRSRSGPESGDAIEGLAGMRAAFIVDSRRWSGAHLTEPPVRSPGARAYMTFGTGYAAAKRSDIDAAARALTALESAAASVRPDLAAYGRIMVLELRGMLESLRGDRGRAVALVREAARVDDSLPIPFGPPLTVKPPHELAGEILLAAGRAEDARAEFRTALTRTPRRPLALLGQARAEMAAGHRADAEASYRLLAEIWRRADADLPDLGEARRQRGASPPPR